MVYRHGDYVVSEQYEGGFLPDVIMLTRYHYYHWGTQLYPMKRFRPYSLLCSHLYVLPPPRLVIGWMLLNSDINININTGSLDTFIVFFK